MIATAGQQVRLGVEVAAYWQPHVLYARLVSISREPLDPLRGYLVREYQPGDHIGIPTGPHWWTALTQIVPWQPPPGFNPHHPRPQRVDEWLVRWPH